MDRADKTIMAVIAGILVVCGLVFLSETLPVSPTSHVLNGNFTIQNKTSLSDGAIYNLIWHGSNTTVQVCSGFQVCANLPVSDAQNVTLRVTAPYTLYDNQNELLTLYP